MAGNGHGGCHERAHVVRMRAEFPSRRQNGSKASPESSLVSTPRAISTRLPCGRLPAILPGARQHAAQHPRRHAVHHDQPVRCLVRGVVEPGLQAGGDLVIGFPARRPAVEQAGGGVDRGVRPRPRRRDRNVRSRRRCRSRAAARRSWRRCQSSSRCSAITASVCSARPGRRRPQIELRPGARGGRAARAPISSAWAKPARVSGVCSTSPCIRADALKTVSPWRAMKKRGSGHRPPGAGDGGGVDRGGGAAQPIDVADDQALAGAGLDDQSEAGAHRRLDLGVGAGVGRPGLAAAADQLEGAAVDPEQHRRALPFLAAEPDMELAAAAPPGPLADRGEGLPALRRGRLLRLGDRVAAGAVAERAPICRRRRAAAAGRRPGRPRRRRRGRKKAGSASGSLGRASPRLCRISNTNRRLVAARGFADPGVFRAYRIGPDKQAGPGTELAMRIHCIALLLAGALATPAFAQDAPPPSPHNSGFRVEALVGWDHTEILDDDRAASSTASASATISRPAGPSSASRPRQTIPPITAASAIFDARRPLLRHVGARPLCRRPRRDPGRPDVLLFGKAGYTNARYVIEFDDAWRRGSATRDGTNLDGIRVGAGAQFGVGRNAYFRTEARYSNYEGGGDRGALWARSASASDRRGKGRVPAVRGPHSRGRSATENPV